MMETVLATGQMRTVASPLRRWGLHCLSSTIVGCHVNTLSLPRAFRYRSPQSISHSPKALHEAVIWRCEHHQDPVALRDDETEVWLVTGAWGMDMEMERLRAKSACCVSRRGESAEAAGARGVDVDVAAKFVQQTARAFRLPAPLVGERKGRRAYFDLMSCGIRLHIRLLLLLPSAIPMSHRPPCTLSHNDHDHDRARSSGEATAKFGGPEAPETNSARFHGLPIARGWSRTMMMMNACRRRHPLLTNPLDEARSTLSPASVIWACTTS